MADKFVSTLRKQVFAKTEDKEVQDDYDCDYFVDEKSRTVSLTAEGIAKAEKFFGVENLADAENTTLSHHINQAMKARGLMKQDIDYVVKDGEIIIVDEFTGRLMYGRRYNEGLHQAIEAKEGVTVASESKTLATVTFQNFFRLYDKLSGMTGTALTEAGGISRPFTTWTWWKFPPTVLLSGSTTPMWSTRPRRANSGPSSSRSSSATPRASLCW